MARLRSYERTPRHEARSNAITIAVLIIAVIALVGAGVVLASVIGGML